MYYQSSPLLTSPISSDYSYLHRSLVIIFDKYAYSLTFCTPFSAYLMHPQITYKYWTNLLYIANLFLPYNK